MSDKLKGYEYLARLMKDYGTTHFFYQEAFMRMTIKQAEEQYGLKGIMAHSEVSAGYMADGYARATGKVGVCGAQSVGSANLAAGLGDAWLGMSPVIALTGKKNPFYQYRNCYQELDHTKMFSGVTKFQADAPDTDQLPRLLRMCYKEASSGKPRPVHLDILSFTGKDAEFFEIQEPYRSEPEYGVYPSQRTLADPQRIKLASNAVSAAKKPILVIGRGANISGAGTEINRLIEKADIPALITPDGKTVIDETHPLFCGVVGNYGMSCANKAIAESDLVIYISTQTADQTTCDWTKPLPGVKVIQIDIDTGELGKNYPDCIGLAGDARCVCGQLAEAIENLKHPAWRQTVRSYFDALLQKQAEKNTSDASPIQPERLCLELSQALPDNAILVSDTGYSTIWTANYVRMKPSQKYYRAAGSLGWAFPASMGIKCGVPDRPVICFTGDGGFYYYMSEMETAIRNNINTVAVVNNNGLLSQCAPLIKSQYGDQAQKGIEKITFAPLSFAGIAEQFGWLGIRVDHPADIKPALNKALAHGKPALIEVITGADCHPLPSV